MSLLDVIYKLLKANFVIRSIYNAHYSYSALGILSVVFGLLTSYKLRGIVQHIGCQIK